MRTLPLVAMCAALSATGPFLAPPAGADPTDLHAVSLTYLERHSWNRLAVHISDEVGRDLENSLVHLVGSGGGLDDAIGVVRDGVATFEDVVARPFGGEGGNVYEPTWFYIRTSATKGHPAQSIRATAWIIPNQVVARVVGHSGSAGADVYKLQLHSTGERIPLFESWAGGWASSRLTRLDEQESWDPYSDPDHEWRYVPGSSPPRLDPALNDIPRTHRRSTDGSEARVQARKTGCRGSAGGGEIDLGSVHFDALGRGTLEVPRGLLEPGLWSLTFSGVSVDVDIAASSELSVIPVGESAEAHLIGGTEDFFEGLDHRSALESLPRSGDDPTAISTSFGALPNFHHVRVSHDESYLSFLNFPAGTEQVAQIDSEWHELGFECHSAVVYTTLRNGSHATLVTNGEGGGHSLWWIGLPRDGLRFGHLPYR